MVHCRPRKYEDKNREHKNNVVRWPGASNLSLLNSLFCQVLKYCFLIYHTDIRNGITCLMTQPAPQVMQHCLLMLDSSVLLFF